MVGGRRRTVYIKFTNQLTEMFFVLGNDAKDRQALTFLDRLILSEVGSLKYLSLSFYFY